MEVGEIPDCGHMSGHVATGEGPTDSLRRFSHKSPSLGTCWKAYIRKSGSLVNNLDPAESRNHSYSACSHVCRDSENSSLGGKSLRNSQEAQEK